MIDAAVSKHLFYHWSPDVSDSLIDICLGIAAYTEYHSSDR